MATIGFVGLGHMGSPMAMNLIKAGHQLRVFDVRQAAIDPLLALGATAAATVGDITHGCDVVFTMLQTGAQVKEVCLGDAGLFAKANPGTLFIDSSSIDVSSSRELHQWARDKGLLMVDAPVSGGVKGAQQATLTIMVGGEDKAFQKAQPFLAHVGKNVIHAGAPGNGQAAKICNNMLLGISMIGVSEAFALGQKLGLDAKTFFAISSKASGQCWSMTSYSPVPGLLDGVPSNNGYQPGFTAQMMLKDLRLSQAAAQDVNAVTPLGAQATALFSLLVNSGSANLDFSAIYRLINGEH